MSVLASLCGRSICHRLCVRSCHCELGQARAAWLLQLQRQRRELRREHLRAAVDRLERNIRINAGSFEAFQLRLLRERQKKSQEVLC